MLFKTHFLLSSLLSKSDVETLAVELTKLLRLTHSEVDTRASVGGASALVTFICVLLCVAA
jgi:hypothetical protein